jgi:SOS-response transcriptional repressor LexA
MYTDTVEAVYSFIHHFIEEHHYSPNYREIAVGCHIAVSTVARYLDHLQMQQRIEYESGMARSIRLVTSQSEKS